VTYVNKVSLGLNVRVKGRRKFQSTIKNEVWDRALGSSGATGSVRVALLFGASAIVLTLIVTPVLVANTPGQLAHWNMHGSDDITTGSIARNSSGSIYTIRTSVVNEDISRPCIVEQQKAWMSQCP